MSRNSSNVTASIGTMTITTKNSAKRLRKLTGSERIGASRPFREPWMRVSRATLSVLGAIAQLGERLDRTQEVGGSSPPSSTSRKPRTRGVFAFYRRFQAKHALPLVTHR